MELGRRFVLVSAAAAFASGWRLPRLRAQEATSMYGLIGKMIATPGNREALTAILLEGTGDMPGCLSYIIAADPQNADAIWITEAWDSQESHAASLTLPAVQQAIARAKPLIAGFGERFVTTPIGGHGLVGQRR
jgi:quinol monooxygenase YgiN